MIGLLQCAMVTALLAGGMGVAILGSVKVPLARRLQIDEAKIGGLVSIFGFAMIPIIFAAGFLTDLLGKQAVFVSGSALMGVSLALLARATTYPAALLAVVLFSAAWSLLINVGNVLTPIAFSGGSTAFATNLGNVFFGLGAFLTPLLVGLFTRRLGLPKTLGCLATMVLVPGFLVLGVDFGALATGSQATAGTDDGLVTLLNDPVMWLLGLAMFCYGPLEASLGAWTTTFLGDRGYSEARAGQLLSAFWLTFMAARLAAAFLLPVGQELHMLIALGVASAVVLSGMVLCQRRGVALGLILAAGTAFGPIFPILMALLLEHFAAALHGRAVGLMFAIGGVGWSTLPLLIGAYARRAGVQRAFSLGVVAAISLVVCGLLLSHFLAA
jgi:fucose permease